MAIIEFEDGSVLMEGDCFQLLESVPDASVDLFVSSPPYCMGKNYERTKELRFFVDLHERILPIIGRKVKLGGSICWQVGNHISSGVLTPLDFQVHRIMSDISEFTLRNRIVWTFGHGKHSTKRLSIRYETVLWYTKGEPYYFDVDAIRVPQKYPGKRAYKGPRKGEYTSNPLGKNPSDVWDIPNVKANHLEKTDHPCQFPIELAKRLVLGMSPPGGIVLDPFTGSGSTGAASVLCGRRFIGSESESRYAQIAVGRIRSALNGTLRYRGEFTPIMPPIPTHAVSRRDSAPSLT